VVTASTAGVVVAALALYYLGFSFGEERLRWLVKRVERPKLVFGSDLDRGLARCSSGTAGRLS
jgi:membrane protein DedA with SNARE-associated domain